MRKTILTAAACLMTSVATARADEPVTQPAAAPVATTQPATTQPVVIDWADAAKHVGETVTVKGIVVTTHANSNGKTIVLNIGKDYPDTGRFTIMMPTPPDPTKVDETYKGKTVSVTGKIELYRKAPEVKVSKVSDVTISP